jgi:transcriptional regulator GlxA family with amidase domain
MTRNVAILLFPDVELLDFAGPFEVFSATSDAVKPGAFAVHAVGRDADGIRASNGLIVLPGDTFESVPPPEVLVVPGGAGTKATMDDPETMQWLADAGAAAEVVLSVCTGVRLLAKLGWLDGLAATTHHSAVDELRRAYPNTAWTADARFVDNGRIVTAGGVAAGIDASLHVVARLLGMEFARAAARHIEYPWTPPAV